jgi:hypothetical protein
MKIKITPTMPSDKPIALSHFRKNDHKSHTVTRERRRLLMLTPRDPYSTTKPSFNPFRE